MPTEDVDYSFVESKLSPEKTLVHLLRGPYEGVIYSYDLVKVTEDQTLGAARLSFHYTIHRVPPEKDPDLLQSDHSFHHHLGDILTSILLKQESKIGKPPTHGKQSTTTHLTELHI